jgi:hypothetical protein
MPRGRIPRVLAMLRGIFDKETRRKTVAVVGAAMELSARWGLGKTSEAPLRRASEGWYWGWALRAVRTGCDSASANTVSETPPHGSLALYHGTGVLKLQRRFP